VFSPSRSHVWCYFYFSVAVIFIGFNKNTVLFACKKLIAEIVTFGVAGSSQAATCTILPAKPVNEGEVNFPIQVHCEACYFYCGAVIFIGSADPRFAWGVP
jgi:hypothetical protein